MRDQEEHSANEAGRLGKLPAEEAEQLAKEQVRKKIYLAREREIEKAQKADETKRAMNRATEEIKELAREKARKEAFFTREKTMAEAQEARKLKDKKQLPE